MDEGKPPPPRIIVPKEKDFAPPPIVDPSRSDLPYVDSERLRPEPPTENDVISLDSDTATNSSDEFDWDEDEEANVQQAKKKSKAKRGRFVWSLFVKLAKPLRVVIVGILGCGVLITPLLVFQFRFPNNVARPQVHLWSLWFSIIFAAACITYIVVDIIPKIVIRLILLFGGHVERRKIQLELIFATRGWTKLMLDIAWAWISLSVLRTIYKPPGSYWVIINRVMQALFTASIILLIEKIFLRFVAINFHQKALADRIVENRMGLKALDRLSNTEPTRSRKKNNPYKKGHNKSSPSGSFDMLGFGHKRASVTPSPIMNGNEKGMKSPSPTGKKAKRDRRKAISSVIVNQLGDAIGQVALKDSKLNKTADLSGLASARKLAKKLFESLNNVYPPRDHLVVDDFYPFFESNAEAHQAFSLFDKDGNGDITKKEMREAVQRIYRERKALTASLKDVGSAVAKLDGVLIVVALLLIIFACLLIFNRENTIESLVPMATIILGFSFAFGNSAQQLFESLIFIFSTHVFDVGDLVMIDEQPLFVREFGLFSTTFRRVDGQEIIAPNSLLAKEKLVHNIRRSNSMWETTNLMVSYDTPLEAIEQLRTRMQKYIAENSREWNGCALNVDKMEFQNAIHLIVAIEHKANWQDWGGRWNRRTQFMRALRDILEELDVRYTMPIQPVVLPRPPPGSFIHRQPSTTSSGSRPREDLGNAGFFQGSTMSAPRGLRANIGSFEGGVA